MTTFDLHIADKISPQTRIKLFADDCLLYRTINTKQDHKQLQQDLNTLVDWSHTWLNQRLKEFIQRRLSRTENKGISILEMRRAH
jgi:hypothetical protein